jgi:polyvinyl alcohol dehydrogenase (cytochrome)
MPMIRPRNAQRFELPSALQEAAPASAHGVESMKTSLRLGCFFALLPLGAPFVACSSSSGPGAAAPAPSSTVSEWPSYGHDGKNTRFNSAESIITKANVNTLARVWDSATTGVTATGVTSTPAVVDGVVYFGDWGGMVHAVKAADGSPVWSTQVAADTSGPLSQVNDSPFVTANAVYIGGTNNEVYGLNRADGSLLWNPRRQIGSQQNTVIWSSPAVVDDTLLIGVGSFEVFVSSTFNFKGNVVGMNATTGAVDWTTFVTDGNDASSGFGCSVWGSAAIDTTRKLAYIGVGQGYSEPVSPYSDSVVAMDYTTGAIKWGHQYTANDIYTAMTMPNGDDYDVGASPTLYEIGSQAYVAAGDKGGHIEAMDRDTGKLLWATMLTMGGQTGGVMASPAVANGKIYVYSNDGSKGNFGTSGPAAGVAFRVDGATGHIDWQTPIVPGAFGGIAVAGGVMFFTTLDGFIHALDADTGTELWNDHLMNGTATNAGGGVTVANGMVFAGAGWQWLPTDSFAGGLTAYGLSGLVHPPTPDSTLPDGGTSDATTEGAGFTDGGTDAGTPDAAGTAPPDAGTPADGSAPLSDAGVTAI